MSRFALTGGTRRASVPRNLRTRAEAQPLEPRILLAAFVVNNAGDGGPGTLRQAILDANATADADTITFNLPGAGSVRTIRPLSALPAITGQTSIDGSTRAGVAVELDGSLAGAGANGLTVSGSNSLVRGLVINRFAGHGVVLGPVVVNGRPGLIPSGIHLELNYIGTDWTGNVALANGGAGVMVSASATVIGQTVTSLMSPAAGNVISGNGLAGIWVAGRASNMLVMGNFIGTNAAGSRPLGNGREGILIEAGTYTIIGGIGPRARNVISGNASSGIRLSDASPASMQVMNNYIGTDFSGANAIPNGASAAAPFHDGITIDTGGITGSFSIGSLQPNINSRNLISGNAGAGVNVLSGGEVHVIGNYIGTDATGNADLGNGSDGVVFAGTATAVAYGRVNGNLISGNGGDGVRMGGNAQLAVPIGGNYIGTNANGTAALGNGGSGIDAAALATGIQIGMQAAAPPVANPPAPINPAGTARNLISANGGDGIRITGDGHTTLGLIGNYIGTDVTGTVPLGNRGSGVYLEGVVNSTIGGESPPVGNLISANGGDGITLIGSVAATSAAQANNHIQSNRIGTAAADPTKPATYLDPGDNAGLGNHGNGVAIYYSSHNRVGFTGGNVIAYNDGNGIRVEGSSVSGRPGSSAVGNYFGQNSIYGNGRLGIDLVGGGEGVTPNDAGDADTGPNGLQNFPVITDATANAAGTSVQIRFTLATAPGIYQIEFFASPLADPSGYGEGRTSLGFVTVTTDANGAYTGTTTKTVPGGQAASLYYTATATNSGNQNTSEFGPSVRGTPPPPPNPQDVTTVTERRVFYNDSVFDGNDPAGNTADLAAVAPDKRALIPGQAASAANVTSYSKGINGIELLFFSPSLTRPTLTAGDLELGMGEGGDPGGWGAAPAPASIDLIPIPGPNTMYDITWADGAVKNSWLRVRVKATANTGLAADDVFYFGNLVGDTGGEAPAGTFRVNAIDLARTRAAVLSGAPADASSRFDFNRDGVVNAVDLALVRTNYNRSIAWESPLATVAGVAQDGAARAYRPAARLAEEVLG